MSNLDLWDRVSKTNPDHTKKAGRFTAIDAYQQIRTATAEFGRVGEGWGWKVQSEQVIDGHAIVRIQFWWRQGDPAYPGPHEGRYELETHAGDFEEYGTAIISRMKDEAFKSALTDAITKALSRLGFNADVFLGKFDSNKYVEERKREIKKEETVNAYEVHKELFDQVMPIVQGIRDPDDLKAWYKDVEDALPFMKEEARDLYDKLVAAYNEARQRVKTPTLAAAE